LIATREKSLRTRVQQIDDDIANKERQIERKQEALTEKFSRLQGALSNLQQQQQSIGATLGGGGNNLVAQLLGG
jgi:flagellar capping protein FliD